jgi:hypothetical protein
MAYMLLLLYFLVKSLYGNTKPYGPQVDLRASKCIALLA